MDGRGAGIARAGARDGLHHQRRFGQAEARAAIFLREGNAEPAARGHGITEFLRPVAGLVRLRPVIIPKGFERFFDGGLDGGLIFTHRRDLMHVT